MPKEIKKPMVPFEYGEELYLIDEDGEIIEGWVNIQTYGMSSESGLGWLIELDSGDEFDFEQDWCRTVFPSYEDAEKSLRLKARDNDA